MSSSPWFVDSCDRFVVLSCESRFQLTVLWQRKDAAVVIVSITFFVDYTLIYSSSDSIRSALALYSSQIRISTRTEDFILSTPPVAETRSGGQQSSSWWTQAHARDGRKEATVTITVTDRQANKSLFLDGVDSILWITWEIWKHSVQFFMWIQGIKIQVLKTRWQYNDALCINCRALTDRQ